MLRLLSALVNLSPTLRAIFDLVLFSSVGAGLAVYGFVEIRTNESMVGDSVVVDLELLEQGNSIDPTFGKVTDVVARHDMSVFILSNDETPNPSAEVRATYYPVVSQAHPFAVTGSSPDTVEATPFAMLVKTVENFQVGDVPSAARKAKQIEGVIKPFSDLSSRERTQLNELYPDVALEQVVVLSKDELPSVVMPYVWLVGGLAFLVLGVGLFVFRWRTRDDDAVSAFDFADGTNWIKSRVLSKPVTAPNPLTCRYIYKIAKGAPATTLGLSRGDLLVRVDGCEAVDLDMAVEVEDEETVKYEFFIQDTGAILTVEAKGIPLGIHLEHTNEAIVERCRTHDYQDDEFLMLYKREEWSMIHTACMLALELPENTAVTLGAVEDDLDMIATAYLAVYLQHMGDFETGDAILEAFLEGSMDEYNATQQGFLYGHGALMCSRHEDDETAANWAEHAIIMNDGTIEAIDILLAEFNLTPPASALGRTINRELQFGYLSEDKVANLQHALHRMTPHQLLPLCSMAECRVNRSYDNLMETYRLMYPYLQKHILPIWVVTGEVKASRAEMKEAQNEALCLKKRVPVVLLHDEKNTIAKELNLVSSPTLLFLNNQGTVVHQSDGREPGDYWTALHEIHTDVVARV